MASKFQFYTWHFSVGFHPHSVVVLAKTKGKAIEKALRCVEEKKIFKLEGPYTTSIDEILIQGLSTSYDDRKAPRITFREFLEKTEPKVTDSDCLISISALDG